MTYIDEEAAPTRLTIARQLAAACDAILSPLDDDGTLQQRAYDRVYPIHARPCPLPDEADLAAMWTSLGSMWDRFSVVDEVPNIRDLAASILRRLPYLSAAVRDANVSVAGDLDARLGPAVDRPSRFRPRYRQMTPAEVALHDEIKAKAAELEALFDRARNMRFPDPDSTAPTIDPATGAFSFASELVFDPAATYFDEGMKSLEAAVMWTIKGLTS